MLTVISHFFNEEYLLPWWLMHHREMADHGVLIDFASTDLSREVIHELVPDWQVLPGPSSFSAQDTDKIVMAIELGISDWKVCLNTTEFLLGPVSMELGRLRAHVGIRPQGLTMVDLRPEDKPTSNQSLITQKPWGLNDKAWLSATSSLASSDVAKLNSFRPRLRRRLIHRASAAEYRPGRHKWISPAAVDSKRLRVAWFGLSPWTAEGIARKLQIADRIPAADWRSGNGVQHLLREQDLSKIRNELSPFATDVRTKRFFERALRVARPVSA